jgi:hypothetical protein
LGEFDWRKEFLGDYEKGFQLQKLLFSYQFKGSPGNVDDFEEWLFDANEMLESVKCMAVTIRMVKDILVGFILEISI